MRGRNFRTFEYDEADPHPRTALAVCNHEFASYLPTAVSPSPAFTDALVAQRPALRRYAVALVGNAALADDLVQDCIEKALGQESQLRELERLGGWLRRILHNLYIDEIRRGKRRGRERDIAELTDHLELSEPAPDNSAKMEFVHAVNRLSVEHRQILLLVSVEELSYREIADELEIPLGTVMSRLARARERLRSVLQGESTVVAFLPDRKEKK
jgi:RNA polymerase sigma-70 factor (ECF subfamily)